MRVVSAGVLSLAALLAWMAADSFAQRGHGVVEATAVARSEPARLTSASDAVRRLTSRTATRSGRVILRQLLLARARGVDSDGDPTFAPSLAGSRVELLGDVANSARAQLRRLAQRHLPYGEPSPFDATAPPTSSRRNG
jgi:hypothetical protein